MAPEAANDSDKREELKAIIEAVRQRVRARYPAPGVTTGSNGDLSHGSEPIQVRVADLMPIAHARDAAQSKIAAIGSVNPRAGGPINAAIQFVKKAIARGLRWFVRDQITFNSEAVAAIETIIEALNEHNYTLAALAGHANEGLQEVKDARRLLEEQRVEWDRRVTTNEIQFLRSVADFQGAFQHRTTLMESNFREIVKAQHADYLGALDRANIDIQKKLWADLEKIRSEYGRLIHDELRVIRLRQLPTPASATAQPVAASQPPALDYTRFAFRFRGPEEQVSRTEDFYRPFFADRTNVLDIGCGRGEFLELMREMGIPAKGIDLGTESVAQCLDKGLQAEVADLFTFVGPSTEGEFDGIFASQIVEHIEPGRLPEMIRLCARSLRRGGVLAMETPNPDCLAIFATYFYLDPTHTRPVPRQLLEFYMEEAGIGFIEVHELSPAVDAIPEIAELPEGFRKRFFGGMDYAIIGRKL
ncbi:MAG TPA: class I SAM-dependent methyltransferase [Bryobacteraceae bacterium]|nr:class I SAM-dependent methyltransferase [Bryobacteraceae bacterium]